MVLFLIESPRLREVRSLLGLPGRFAQLEERLVCNQNAGVQSITFVVCFYGSCQPLLGD